MTVIGLTIRTTGMAVAVETSKMGSMGRKPWAL
jgi:hypothetical protein